MLPRHISLRPSVVFWEGARGNYPTALSAFLFCTLNNWHFQRKTLTFLIARYHHLQVNLLRHLLLKIGFIHSSFPLIQVMALLPPFNPSHFTIHFQRLLISCPYLQFHPNFTIPYLITFYLYLICWQFLWLEFGVFAWRQPLFSFLILSVLLF